VDGQVRANTVKKVSDFVSANPNESVALLRTWLHEST
jgi:flagellar M-ring protein FliF